MSRRLRPHRFASRPLRDALTLFTTLCVLVCVELSLGGFVGGNTPVFGSTPGEAFGLPGTVPQPIALTSSRTLALVAGLGDGRHRTGQLVEPGDATFTAAALPMGNRLADHQARPLLVLARGLLTVRAPPLSAA